MQTTQRTASDQGLVLVQPSLDSIAAVEITSGQPDLSLRWSHKSYCRFCRALAHILILVFNVNSVDPDRTPLSVPTLLASCSSVITDNDQF